MNTITDALETATTLFSAVVLLAVTVTGFFKGLSWLRDAAGDQGPYSNDPEGGRDEDSPGY